MELYGSRNKSRVAMVCDDLCTAPSIVNGQAGGCKHFSSEHGDLKQK